MDDINDVKVYDENLQGDENDENRRRLDRRTLECIYVSLAILLVILLGLDCFVGEAKTVPKGFSRYSILRFYTEEPCLDTTKIREKKY